MANEVQETPVNSEHFKLVRIVVLCVAAIAMVCAVSGVILAIKGFTEAQMMIQASATATGGLLGLVTLRGSATPGTTVTGNDATVITPPSTPEASGQPK